MFRQLKILLGHDERGPLPDLETLRNRVVRLALSYILVFSAPILLIGVYRSLSETWNWYTSVQIFTYVSLLFGFLFFPRKNGKALSHLVVAMVIMLGVCGIAGWGPAPSRFIVLSFGCIFAAMFNGATYSVATLFVSTVLISLAAYMHPHVLILDGGDSVSSHTPKQWVVTVASYTFYTTCCSLLVAWVTRSLQGTITALRKREEELQFSNDMLKDQAVRLEEQAVELEEQAEGLIEERDRADNAAKAKDRFLSVVSHELRTPLNPILGYLDLLQEDEAFESESREKLYLMRKSGEHLLLMIDKLVDFSEMDRIDMTLTRSQTSWHSVRTEIEDRLGGLARERGLQLVVECKGPANESLFLDTRRTLQVVEELGTNALTFTEAGKVTIRLGTILGEDNRHWLTISVRDTGCGLEKDEVDGLFDSFTQRDCGHTRQVGGFGLGLSMCDAIVTALGGTIKVKSEVGKGSTFSTEFPIEVHRTALANLESSEKKTTFLGPISVLVVEDEIVNQKVVRTLLKRMGAVVDCADDGQQALDALKSGNYDVVLMDISMPVMDGIEATKVIRRTEGIMDLPVIALTAHSFAKSEESCYEAGMDAFLTKPVKVSQLFETISRCLEKKASGSSSLFIN